MIRMPFLAGLILSALALTCATADAQTVANGPYYATPSWDQKIACSSPATCPRFVVLADWNHQAVLDRETGLVWERTPGGPGDGTEDWGNAYGSCIQKRVANRMGWRLPSLQELQSLLDTNVQTNGLPAGHPFFNISTTELYWSATRSPNGPTLAFAVGFESGGSLGGDYLTVGQYRYWCVRGPGGPAF
jgi:hypothetical protein